MSTPVSKLVAGWVLAGSWGSQVQHYSTGRGFLCGASRGRGRPRDNFLATRPRCSNCEQALAARVELAVNDTVLVASVRTCYAGRVGFVLDALPGKKYRVLLPARTRAVRGPTGVAGTCTDPSAIVNFLGKNLTRRTDASPADIH